MLARFWSFARPYLPYYLAGLALLLVTNGLGVAIPWVLRDAIHALEGRVEPRAIAGYAAIIVGLGLAQALVRTLSRWSVLGASRQVAFDLRQRFFAQLQRLDAPYYDTHRTGDIMSRGVNDIQLVQMFYGPGALNLLNTTIVYVAALALMFRLDARLTLVALTLYPPLLWAVNRLSRKMYARSVAVQEGLADISSRAQENVSGIQQVKLFVQEDREIAAFRELCGELRRRNLAMVALRGGMLSLIGVFSGIGTLVVLFVGGRAVISGRMSFGDFVAFNAYLGMLAWPTIALGWIINVFQRGAGAMERLDEVLRVEPRIPPPGPKAPGETPLDGDIEIRGLTFAYGNEPALRDVTLDIPRGSRVALVGPVGSGKSTLVHLLARIYPAPAGTVFVDGSDLTALPTAELRQGVGMVPQEAFLFSRSIRDNVLLGRPAATPDELARALAAAHLGGDLAVLPAGAETVVGERGVTLSGGQRQRVTLARALLRDPRLLILDDALSSVDADTEHAILEELRALMRGRTSIVVSHRLSSVADIERIVVLDAGRIVEQGTHAELLARDGLYARLYRKSQLEASLEGR